MRSMAKAVSIGLLSMVAVAGLAPVAQAAEPGGGDIKVALQQIPGLTIVKEDPAPAGFRFFELNYTQPADHRHPQAGTFQQRFTLLHRDFAAPTVAYTSGYNVSTVPNRSEPTQIVDGNQLSMEYRYFLPSRPNPENWSQQLTIWQAAADEHRAVQAFKAIYPGKWLATGGSKGGMTATYFRRFFPNDVNGTIPYVAPNEVVQDGSYNRFLARVGDDPACRDNLKALQRDTLRRRAELGAIATADAAKKGYTFSIVGSVDESLEIAVIDSYFAFWQYQKQADCATVPKAGAPADQIYAWFEKVESLNTYADQEVSPFIPYYYQAAVQLNAPEAYDSYLRDLLRYPGADAPRTFVPKSIKVPPFQPFAMADIDWWVKTQGSQFLFVYGANDPWGAEPFVPSRHDSSRYFVAGGNHGSRIAQLPADQAATATATVRRWAGLPATPAGPSFRLNMVGFPQFDADLSMVGQPRL
ncbi:tripeptidyl aminopeptidase [Kutzneria sp. CA-103260]|nr:tripeptidyl aminopeptidase [Kutzneria sp. CA-103260]